MFKIELLIRVDILVIDASWVVLGKQKQVSDIQDRMQCRLLIYSSNSNSRRSHLQDYFILK